MNEISREELQSKFNKGARSKIMKEILSPTNKSKCSARRRIEQIEERKALESELNYLECI